MICRVATRPRDIRGANLHLGICQVSPGGVWETGSVLRRRVPGLIPRERRSPAGCGCVDTFPKTQWPRGNSGDPPGHRARGAGAPAERLPG